MSSSHVSPTTGKGPPARCGKRRAVAELFVAYVLIMAVIWTPRPWQRILWVVAVVVVALLAVTSLDFLRGLGLRWRNLRESLWVVAAALLLAVCAALVAACLHTLQPTRGTQQFLDGHAAYAIWSCVQQFLLQGFFLARLLRIAPSPRWAAIAATVLFTLAHLPNPLLAVLAALWGTASCLIFLRYRNLIPVAIAHAILGITISITVPGPVIHNMRVGLGYLRYHGERARRFDQRSQSDQSVSTVACVTAEVPTLR